MLELYHWEPVSHSAKVLICLQEIGVKFASHFVDLLKFEQFSGPYLAVNPMAQVPVLKTGNVLLSESSLINEYLAESFPDAGLAPTDAQGWYDTQIWSKYIDYNLSSSVATLGCQKFLTPLLQQAELDNFRGMIDAIPVPERKQGWQAAISGNYAADALTNSERKIKLVIEKVESRLSTATWLVGDRYSIADINTFAMLDAIRSIEPSLVNAAAAPGTQNWLARVEERPAVQAVVATRPSRTAFAPGPEHSRWG